MRIFVAVTKVIGDKNSAVITLASYRDNISRQKTAVLENHNLNSFRNTLDQFDNQVPEISVPNDYGFDLPYWLQADFTMNYDPCTCNSKAKLIFEVRLVDTSTLKFTTNGTQIQNLDQAGNGASGRQSFLKLGQDLVDAGNSFYKTAQDGLNNFKSIFPNAIAKNDVDAMEKIIPGFGAAAGVVDFLSGLFGGSTTAPIVYDVNLQSTGTIQRSSPHKTVIFEIPGSDNLTADPPTLLNYNNPLGVFTVIKKPTVFSSFGPAYDGWINNQNIPTRDIKYRVADDIRYVINPASGLDPNTIDIKCALIFEYPVQLYNSLPSEGLNNNLIDEGVVNGNHIYRTQFVNAGCLLNLSAFVKSGFISISKVVNRTWVFYNVNPTVYLKVVATLKPSINSSQTFAFISKYKVSESRNDNLFSASGFWGFDAWAYNQLKDLSLQEPSSSSVKAWNLTLSAGFSITPSVQDGQGRNYIGGNTITMLANGSSVAITTTPSNTATALKIESPLADCNRKVDQADASIICNSLEYINQANPVARVGDIMDQINQDSADKYVDIPFQAFPNPTSSKVSFRYYIEEPTQVQLNLISTTGSVVATPVSEYQEAGPYETSYDASNLPAGVYIYTLETSKGKETKRLVVIK